MAPEIRISLKVFLLSCLAVFAVECAASQVPWEGPGLILVAGVRILQAGLILAVFHFFGNGLVDFGLSRGTVLSGLFRGALWALGFGVLVGMAMAVLMAMGINPFLMFQTGRKAPLSGWPLVCSFLVVGLIGPVAEEIFFRGALYGFLRRWGAVAAILVSTVFLQ